MKRRFYYFAYLAFLVCILFARQSMAQTTSFTYQGKLNDTSMAASGNYDFQFAIFDSQASPSADGPVLTQMNVPVTNGIFTVMLDFGNSPNPFASGADRSLQ